MFYSIHVISTTETIPATYWLIGVGLAILASLVAAISKLAIRKSWILQGEETCNNDDNNDSEGQTADTSRLLGYEDGYSESDELHPSTSRRNSCRRNPRVLRYSGMFGMSVVNPILTVLAMNYASPSILAPFSGLTLVWVIFFSGMLVGENPSKSEISAAVLITCGEIIVAVFGDHTSDNGKTVEDVRHSYLQPASIAYFTGLSLYMILLLYWIICSPNPGLKRFAWGSSGGALTGAQCFLKDTLTVLKLVAYNKDESFPWFFPLLILFSMLTAFCGLLCLTACMKRYDVTYSAAAFVGSIVVSSSINSATHYNTFSSLPSIWNDIFYPFGLIVLIAGVYLLERDPDQDQTDIAIHYTREESQLIFHADNLGDENTPARSIRKLSRDLEECNR